MVHKMNALQSVAVQILGQTVPGLQVTALQKIVMATPCSWHAAISPCSWHAAISPCSWHAAISPCVLLSTRPCIQFYRGTSIMQFVHLSLSQVGEHMDF